MGINDLLKIGNTLKKIRLANNLTQKQFAERISIGTSTYANYEQNLREPSTDVLNRIIKEFNVDLSTLLNPEHHTITCNANGDVILSNPYERIQESFETFLNDSLAIYALEGNEVGFLSPLEKKSLLKAILSTQSSIIQCIEESSSLDERIKKCCDNCITNSENLR